jgi:hypothetical protein
MILVVLVNHNIGIVLTTHIAKIGYFNCKGKGNIINASNDQTDCI